MVARRGDWLMGVVVACAACGGEQSSAPHPPGLPVVRAGTYAACGVSVAGELRCWGEIAAPPNGTFLDVSIDDFTGTGCSCAIRSDETVVCWPQTLELPGSGYVRLMHFFGTVCGLRRDGEIVCRTHPNGIEVSGSPPEVQFSELGVSFGLCAITSDGAIECWNGSPAPEGDQFVAVATMDIHGNGACGLDRDGRVTCTGLFEQPPDGTRFSTVSVAYRAACGINDADAIECWGALDGLSQHLQQVPEGPFIRLSLGSEFACGVRPDYSVACWGRADEGQISSPADLGP